MNRRTGAWLYGVIFCLTALPAAAQKTGQYVETTDVLVVEVPVQVLRDGEPVRDLTADDFEVYDGRKKQALTGFEVLDLAETGSAASAAAPRAKTVVPPSARRRFLLFFDITSSTPGSLEKARLAARTLIKGLHPTDLVGVATFDSRGADFLLGFTPDRRQLETALGRLGEVVRSADPLRLVMGMGEGDLLASAGGGRSGGRGGSGGRHGGGENLGTMTADPTALLMIEEERFEEATRKHSIYRFSDSVEKLAQVLSGIQGRKHVVLLSEGFDSQTLYGTQDMSEIARMNAASERGEIWQIDSNARYGSTQSAQTIEVLLDALRRADCVIQSVDIAGVRSPGDVEGRAAASGKQEGLFVLAESTGGELYTNFSDLSEAMGAMLKRNSVTYVLSFQPDGVEPDGRFRRLRVELKDGRGGQGARVVHRPGYYAPKPFAQKAALERVVDTASQITAGREGGSIATAVLAAPFARAQGKAYVPVLIEAAGEGLLAGQKEGVLPAEIFVYAFDESGQVRDFFARSLGLDVARVGPALRHSGLKMFGDLELDPGSYSLRVLVRNGSTGAASLRAVSLEVPAFTAAAPVLSPPFFPEPHDRWLLVRENADPPKDVTYPFLDRQRPYIPAARPALRPGEEARLSLVGWHLRPGDLRAEALVLTADGKPAGPGEIRVLERQVGQAGEPDRIAAAFRTPTLAPGDYQLLVTLTDPVGTSWTSTAELTLVPEGGR